MKIRQFLAMLLLLAGAVALGGCSDEYDPYYHSVPGGGYVYDRQPASALTALIVNGLLAYATATSIKSNNYGVAAVMGVFSLTFYTGNILGAVSGAKRYNKRRVDACATSIERANNIYW